MSTASPTRQTLPPLPFAVPPLPVPEVIERTDAWVWHEWDEAQRALDRRLAHAPR